MRRGLKLPLMSSEDTSAFMLRGYYGPRDDKRHLIPSYDDDAAPGAPRTARPGRPLPSGPSSPAALSGRALTITASPRPTSGRPTARCSDHGPVRLEKTAFHIHQAQWVHDRPVLALVPHWNWQGREGQPVKVMVCSNLDEVGLELNGRLLGRQPVDRWTMNHWQVPYEAGVLRALGWKAGRLVAKAQVETVARPPRCAWCPDPAVFEWRWRGRGAVRVEAIDAQGRAHPLANHMVQFRIEGGEIIGLGNGDSNSIEPEKGDRRSLFHGLAQVIVRSNAGGTGELKLTTSTDGLQSGRREPRPHPRRRAPPAGHRHQPAGAAVVAARAAASHGAGPATPNPHRRDMNSWQGFQAGYLLPLPPPPAMCSAPSTTRPTPASAARAVGRGPERHRPLRGLQQRRAARPQGRAATAPLVPAPAAGRGGGGWRLSSRWMRARRWGLGVVKVRV